MQISIRELRALIREAKQEYNWYHLSQNDLGDEFTFTPRKPKFPWKGKRGITIEDDFTPRTSWANSVQDAYVAIKDSITDFNKPLYVYATNKLPGEIDVEENFLDAPSSPGNDYGESFDVLNFIDYAEEEGWPKELLRTNPNGTAITALKGQVPDAPTTGEHWATKPVKAKKIGIYNQSKALVEPA